jgi:hypothetical protein
MSISERTTRRRILECYRRAHEVRRFIDTATNFFEKADFIAVRRRWFSLAQELSMALSSKSGPSLTARRTVRRKFGGSRRRSSERLLRRRLGRRSAGSGAYRDPAPVCCVVCRSPQPARPRQNPNESTTDPLYSGPRRIGPLRRAVRHCRISSTNAMMVIHANGARWNVEVKQE